jgi:hypothetical protein
MSATMVASGTTAAPSGVSSNRDIPRATIHESKTNERRLLDEANLVELAAENIRQHHALQPIVVPPPPDGKAGTCELVAGARLFRASKHAKREGSCEAPRCPFCRKILSYFFLSRGSLVKRGEFR